MSLARAFIAIGSNIDAEENVSRALRSLARRVQVRAVSTVCRTAAIARPEQPPYCNCVAEIATSLEPAELKRCVLRPIETQLGRKRTTDKFAARTIDLDLIAYGDIRLREGGLVLPDPEIAARPFLAIALAELAPELLIPDAGGTAREIAAGMSHEEMLPLVEFTERLRRELRDEQGKRAAARA